MCDSTFRKLKMGRSYYCEYCDKRMKCTVSIRKSHNDGLPHKIARAEYMARFKDPRDILDVERKKTPCSRFLNGKECKFGLFCHFSHYTFDQLTELERLAGQAARKSSQVPSNSKQTESEYHARLPWEYPSEKVQHMDLPPSLQSYDIDNCTTNKKFVRNEWG